MALAQAQVDIMALFGEVGTAVLNGFCPECGCPSPGPVREGQVVVCPACGCSYTVRRALSEEDRAALEKLIGHVLERFEKEHVRPLAEKDRAWLAAQLRGYAERMFEEVRPIHERLGELPTRDDLEEALNRLRREIIAYIQELVERLVPKHPGLITVGRDEVRVMLEEFIRILRESGLGLLPPQPREPKVWLAYTDMRGRKRIIRVRKGMIIGRSGLDVVVKDEEKRVVRKLGVQDGCVSGVHAMLVFSGGKPVLKVLTERKTNTKIGHRIGGKVVETVVQKGTYPLEDGSIITLGFTRFEVICSD